MNMTKIHVKSFQIMNRIYNGNFTLFLLFSVYDASGRYQSQFFFGNDYWLGSKALCEELVNSETNNEIPPFQVQFYVAKVAINLNDKLTPVVSCFEFISYWLSGLIFCYILTFLSTL